MFSTSCFAILNSSYAFGCLILSLLTSVPGHGSFDTLLSEEICDNGIDDDEDGLIDLNDEDCFCSIIEPVSLIQNPSFEERDCCPGAEANFDCATFWVQASAAYVHYFHQCAFNNPLIPLPLPDGEGVVALLNGKPNEISNYKEYLGACLIEPLRANVPYTLQFEIGFSHVLTPIPIDVSIFGSPDCVNLPFGGNDQLIGCPTNTPNWIYLGKVRAYSNPGWEQLEIDFTPVSDIAAIAIGPPCAPNDLTDPSHSAYYFFDNLILNEAFDFDFEIQADDHPCSSNLTFQVPAIQALSYQWYKNGIALLNETEPILENPPGSGFYQVRIDDGSSCQISRGFGHTLPLIWTELTETICEGDAHFFNNQHLEMPGFYQDTLKTLNNCDSIIRLELLQELSPTKTVFAKIFPFETYNVDAFIFGEAGDHTFSIGSVQGCDTIVNLTLAYYSVYIPNAFSPNNDGINDTFTIYGGDDLQMILSLQIFDRWGGIVYDQQNITPNEPGMAWDGTSHRKKAPEGVFVYRTTLLMDDMKAHTFAGTLTLSR